MTEEISEAGVRSNIEYYRNVLDRKEWVYENIVEELYYWDNKLKQYHNIKTKGE
jgi:hypothetical protein